MVLDHDTELSLQAAAVLANSALPPDTLERVEDLDRFWQRFGYTGRRDGDAAELAAVRALRPLLRELLTSERDRAAELVNDVLARCGAVPRLVRHGAVDWHVHAVGSTEPLDVRVLVETAMAVLELVRLDEVSRLSTCADDGCDGVVVDLSRNRSRRYCSTTCANRNAVSAYRARRSAARAGGGPQGPPAGR
ncbi:RNA-binding protein [Kineococcus sp. T13]|uniref:CGNR zinc finger domain-containing protein n=1 Tax=Kineococcus vitellinus TaxID=2696565 RepID=UPI00141219A5|nr:RNA-binding protein [Kineococcus vitellinus]